MNKVNLKNQIKWRSRRGMLELDLLFKYFNERMLEKLNQEQLENMLKLLDQNDNTLELWLLKNQRPSDKKLWSICKMISDNAILHY